jgi:hypothetical protein
LHGYLRGLLYARIEKNNERKGTMRGVRKTGRRWRESERGGVVVWVEGREEGRKMVVVLGWGEC